MALVGNADDMLSACTGMRVLDRGKGQHKFEVQTIASPEFA